MFQRKGRGLFAVLLVLVLTVPAVGVLAAGNGGNAAAAPDASALIWTQVHQAPAGQYFYGIYFPTKDVGYAVSGPDWNNADNGGGAPTYISKTTDGGKTWKSTAVSVKGVLTDGWMRGITCTDANNCWIAGKAKGRILRTTDGGTTWTAMTNQSGYPNWLWSAGWTGKGTTILAGTTCYDPEDPQAVANWLRSTDGQLFKGVVAKQGTYNCFVQWDIECPESGVCYSAGKDITWRSADDGVTWKGTTMTPRTRQYGLSCTSASSCWIVGKNPWVRSTNDAGANWATNSVAGMPTNGQFWDVVMLDNQTGYAGGCDNVATDNTDRCLGKGALFKTEDGVTWLPVPAPTTADIMDLWAFSPQDVYLVDWSGKIWHGVGKPPAGTITGTAFNDLNQDALRDEGEPGIAGATILLRRGKTEIATTQSGEDGAFSFTDIEPGQYTVQEKSAPAGFAKSAFLATLQIEGDREITVFVPHEAIVSTPTVTATLTASPTPTETATYTPEPTATPSLTPTASATTVRTSGYLPIIVQ